MVRSDKKCNNSRKHKNEASKQTFANNLFQISRKYTQGMLSNPKICFNALKIQNYEDFFVFRAKLIKLYREWPKLTS